MLAVYRHYREILTGLTIFGIFTAVAGSGLLDPFFEKVQTTIAAGLKEIIIWFGWWISLIWTIYHYVPVYPLPLFLLFTFLRMKPIIMERLSTGKDLVLLAEPVDEFVIVEGWDKDEPLLVTTESTVSQPSPPSPRSLSPPPPSPMGLRVGVEDWILL